MFRFQKYVPRQQSSLNLAQTNTTRKYIEKRNQMKNSEFSNIPTLPPELTV